MKRTESSWEGTVAWGKVADISGLCNMLTNDNCISAQGQQINIFYQLLKLITALTREN